MPGTPDEQTEAFRDDVLAGLHPEHSDLPILCTLKGMRYRELIGGILDSACQRLPHVDVPHLVSIPADT